MILGADGSEVDVPLGPKAVLAAAVWDAAVAAAGTSAPRATDAATPALGDARHGRTERGR